MPLQRKTLRTTGMLRPYGMGNDPNDKLTVTQISSAAISSIGLPTTTLRVKKQTFFVGGSELEIVTDISVVT